MITNVIKIQMTKGPLGHEHSALLMDLAPCFHSNCDILYANIITQRNERHSGMLQNYSCT